MRKMFTLLESDVDHLVYDLYRLNECEIEIIQSTWKP
jgi:hypothetical protein